MLALFFEIASSAFPANVSGDIGLELLKGNTKAPFLFRVTLTDNTPDTACYTSQRFYPV